MELDADEIIDLAQRLQVLGVSHFEGLGVKLTFREDVAIPREVEPAKKPVQETWQERRARAFGQIQFPGS